MTNVIEFKGYKINYSYLEDYFNEMKINREERDKILEEISEKHEELLLKYNKNKPPIDDNSLNTFQFKPLSDIKNDLCYKKQTNINYSCNNALFHLLNNIVAKQKEKELIKRIDRLEKISYFSIGLLLLLFIKNDFIYYYCSLKI